MTLELQSIGFSADTSSLKEVITVMDKIGDSAETNSKRVTSSFADIKKATETLSKDKVDIGIDSNAVDKAKAYVEQLNKAVEAVTKMPKGVSSPMTVGASGSDSGASMQTEAKKSVDAVEKLILATKVLRGESFDLGKGLTYLGEGFSKSQATQLASLLLMGKSTEEVFKAKNAFEEFNRMSGVNPFDKSTSGAYRLKKQVEELNLVQKLQAENTNLTRKEIVDYSRDLERISQMEKQGSIDASEAAMRRKELGETYKNNSSILRKAEADANAYEAASKAAGSTEIKRAKELAVAQSYVYGTLEKLNYQVSLVEEGMGKGASNAAFRFEQSLKKLGLSVSEQERLLKQFGDAQTTLAVKQTKDKMDYVARAVAPQITDIVVGLSTGQSPMTVMLQQGGQLRDMFGQMGVASQDMSKVMRESMVQMAGSVKGTLLGMFGLVQGIFLDMGKAAGSSVGKLSVGLTTAFIGFTQGKAAAESFKSQLADVSGESSLAAKVLSRFGAYLAGPFAIALVAAVGSLIAIGVAFKSAFDQQDKLEKSLHSTGASFGFNASQAYDYAKSLTGISQSKAVDVLIEMANAGGFTREQFGMAAKSVYEFSKVTGQSISDVVKQYKDLEKDPVEALYKLNKAMGNIPLAAIAQVDALREAGKASEALTLATNLLAKSQADAVADIKGEWGTLFTMWMGMKSTFGSVGDWIKEAFAPVPTAKALSDALVALNKATKDAEGMPAGNYLVNNKVQAQAEVNRLIAKLNKEQADSKAKADASASSAFMQLGSAELKKHKANEEAKRRETMSFTDFKKSKLKEIYGAEYENMMASVDGRKQALALEGGILSEYTKLREKMNKTEGSKSSSEVKTLKSQFDSQYQILDKELQTQLDLNKKYHEAGILSDQAYFDKQSADTIKYNEKRLFLIEEFNARATAAGGKENGFINQLEKQRQLLSVDALKNYGSQVAEATKALNDFYEKLKDIRLENNLLEENIKGKQALDISMIGMNPDQIARMQAEFDMMEKMKKQREELNAKFKDAESKYTSAGTAMSRGVLDPATTKEDQARLNATFKDAQVVYDRAKTALVGLNEQQTQLVKTAGDTAAIQGSIDRFKELSATVNSINLGQTLASGFDTASNSVAGLVNMMGKLIQTQEDYRKVTEGKKGEELQKLEAQHGKNMIKTYGEMAGAAKGYFAEHTAGHKVLSAVEGVFRTIQIAEAAWTTFSTAASIVRSGYLAIEAQVAALTIPPPFSFAALAATAAILAGLGIHSMRSGNGGSFAATNSGTGTVKGDPTAQSESLSKSIEELNKVDTMTMKYSAKMLVALNQIESNTAGLADLLVSSGMIQTNASSAGIQTGFEKNAIGQLLGGGIGRTAGGLAGGIGGLLGGSVLGANFGTLGLAIGGPLGAIAGVAIGAMIGPLVSNLFGTKTSIQGQGFNIGSQGLGGILGGGLSAQYYTDVERKKKFLGITTSTSRDTYYTEADKLFKDQISLIFSGFAESIKAASPLLGTSLQSVTDKLNNFVVNIGRVETSGLSQEDLQKRLSAVFSALGDNLATSILPGFEKFQKVGEGYYQTIIRVATGVEEAKNVLDNFGFSMVGIQTVMNKQGTISTELVRDSILANESLTGIKDIVAAISGSATDVAQAYSALTDIKYALVSMGITAENTTSSLLAGAGGLSSLQDALSAYQDNFLTEAEQLAAKSTRLSDKFKALGLTMPSTSQGFVDLVKTLGKDTSDAGQKLLGRVLGLSDGFAEIAGSITEAAKATADFNKNIIDYVNNLGLQEAGSSGNYSALKMMFADQLGLARSGNTDARGSLTSYADKLLEAAKNQASSAVEYQTILSSVKAELLGLTTGTYAGTVLTSDVQSLNNSSVVAATNELAKQTTDSKAVLESILMKLTEMQTEDRAEGQSSISKLSTIEKVIKRIDNDDSIRVTSV